MATFADSPFAALTIIVAPAILTNASSVLALGTGNRIARVVDRSRYLTSQLSTETLDDLHRQVFRDQLAGLQIRAQMLLRALRWFYTSLGSFAAAALIAVIGSTIAMATGVPGVADTFATIGLCVGTLGVTGLVTGCSLMVRETRLAVRFLTEEAKLVTR